MLEECAHCHGRVLAMADRRCPSCGNDVSGWNPKEPDFCVVTIADGQRLPGVCIFCGHPTSKRHEFRYKIIRQDYARGTNTVSTILSFLFAWVSAAAIGVGMYSAKKEPKDSIKISLPICECCSQRPIEPTYVDTFQFWFSLKTHLAFVKALAGA